MKLKHLQFQFEIKAVGDDGSFVGYGSVFGTVDSYNERVAPGAFLDSLKEHDARKSMPALLWQHDSRHPIGVYDAIREDKRGLYMEGRLNLDIQLGREARSLMLMESKHNGARAVSGMSIGFMPRKHEMDEDTGIRTLTAVDLWETSIVTFPANQDAQIEAVRAALVGGVMPTKRDIEAILRDAGFSARQAKALLAGGWSELSDERDAEDGLARVSDALAGLIT